MKLEIGDKMTYVVRSCCLGIVLCKLLCFVVQSSEPLDIPNRQGKKAQTKYAMAKMIQKKNIQVNQKVVFDEEGEVRLHHTDCLVIYPKTSKNKLYFK